MPIGLLNLPPEVLLLIFQHLDPVDVFVKLQRVCKRLREVIEVNKIHFSRLVIFGMGHLEITELSKRVLSCHHLQILGYFRRDSVKLRKAFKELMKKFVSNLNHLSISSQSINQDWFTDFFEECTALRVLEFQGNFMVWDWKLQPTCSSVVELIVSIPVSGIDSSELLFSKLPSLSKLVLDNNRHNGTIDWARVPLDSVRNLRRLECDFVARPNGNGRLRNIEEVIFDLWGDETESDFETFEQDLAQFQNLIVCHLVYRV